jgi:flagellum-specific peptidoglycan hydrolase FlgJ
MKWSSRRPTRIDYSQVAIILLVAALVTLFIMLFTLLGPRQTSADDWVNLRTARRMAAVAPPSPYLATWIHQVSRSGNPVTDTQRFVVLAIPTALQAEKQYGVPAAFLLSQAILESDRGRSRLAVAGHNYFGVTYQGHGTPIYIDGIAYQRFASLAASFNQQGHMLTDPSHGYTSALKYKSDVYRYAREVQRLGYCRSTGYAAMIREIAHDFALEGTP